MSESYAVFAARRLVAAVLITLAVTVITFVMLQALAPWGFPDPRPLPTELLGYLERAFLHLDFGISRQRPFRPVASMLADALPADLALMAGSIVFGLVLGVAGGVVCVRRRGSLLARLFEAAAAVFVCAPVYFVGLMTILLFSPDVGGPIPIFLVKPNSYAGLFENPYAWARALLVPSVVAGLPLAAMALRMVRATLPDALAEDFVLMAAAKGLEPRKITLWHALPVALPPTLSLAGAYAPMLFANVVLVEAVFGIPGIYRLIPGAVENANFPVLLAIVVVGTVIVVACNAIVDVALAALDPRVRA